MKELNLLVWVTQLGISVAAPLACFVLLGKWLHESCGWGQWAVVAGILLGIFSAFSGFLRTLRILGAMSGNKKKDEPPPLSFNNHE